MAYLHYIFNKLRKGLKQNGDVKHERNLESAVNIALVSNRSINQSFKVGDME